MNIQLFSFIKNEAYLLRRWIPHHASIVGLENIHIIDHQSDDQECIDLLGNFEAKGLNVITTSQSFQLKYELLTRRMHKYKSKADILIPIDADEFLCLAETDGTMTAEPEMIREQLDDLPVNGKKYAFNLFEAVVDQFDYEDPLIEMKNFMFFEASEDASGPNQQTKTFFPAKNFSYTDQGNHKGGVLLAPNDRYNTSSIAIAHYHMMGYSHFLEKLQKAIKAYNLTELSPDYVGTGMRWNRWYHQTKNLDEDGRKEWFMKNFLEKDAGSTQHALSKRFRNLTPDY